MYGRNYRTYRRGGYRKRSYGRKRFYGYRKRRFY